jgi:hypothetical protein
MARQLECESGNYLCPACAMPNLAGCQSSSGNEDLQFQKQVKRAQECRQLQDKLVRDQPLTPERREEIVKTMNGNGCTAGEAVDPR